MENKKHLLINSLIFKGLEEVNQIINKMINLGLKKRNDTFSGIDNSLYLSIELPEYRGRSEKALIRIFEINKEKKFLFFIVIFKGNRKIFFIPKNRITFDSELYFDDNNFSLNYKNIIELDLEKKIIFYKEILDFIKDYKYLNGIIGKKLLRIDNEIKNKVEEKNNINDKNTNQDYYEYLIRNNDDNNIFTTILAIGLISEIINDNINDDNNIIENENNDNIEDNNMNDYENDNSNDYDNNDSYDNENYYNDNSGYDSSDSSSSNDW